MLKNDIAVLGPVGADVAFTVSAGSGDVGADAVVASGHTPKETLITVSSVTTGVVR